MANPLHKLLAHLDIGVSVRKTIGLQRWARSTMKENGRMSRRSETKKQKFVISLAQWNGNCFCHRWWKPSSRWFEKWWRNSQYLWYPSICHLPTGPARPEDVCYEFARKSCVQNGLPPASALTPSAIAPAVETKTRWEPYSAHIYHRKRYETPDNVNDNAGLRDLEI